MLSLNIVVNSVQCNLILISIVSELAEITLLSFSYSVENENILVLINYLLWTGTTNISYSIGMFEVWKYGEMNSILKVSFWLTLAVYKNIIININNILYHMSGHLSVLVGLPVRILVFWLRSSVMTYNYLWCSSICEENINIYNIKN